MNDARPPGPLRVIWVGPEKPAQFVEGVDEMTWTEPGPPRIQIALIPQDGSPPRILAGDDTCDADPCELHRRCHCMCPCQPDGNNNCQDCASL